MAAKPAGLATAAGPIAERRGGRLHYSTRAVSAGFLAAALLICLVARVLVVFGPWLDVDEAVFAATAVRAIEQQQPVLQGSRDNKPPGVAAVYRLAFDLGGRYDMAAVHALGLIWVLLTAGVIWFGSRGWAGAPLADFAAGFYLLATSLDAHFLAFKTELMMNLPLAAAFCLAVWGLLRRSEIILVLAGVAAGLAFAFKQPAAIILVGLGLGMVLYCLLQRRLLGPLAWLLLPGSFTLGFAVTLAAIAGWYLWHGAFYSLYLQTVTLPLQFAGRERLSLQHWVYRTLTDLSQYSGFGQFLFFAAFLGVLAPFLASGGDAKTVAARQVLRCLLPLTLVFAMAALLSAPDFFPAYFMLGFVPLAIGAGSLGALIFESKAWRAAPAAHRLMLGGGFVLALCAAAVSAWGEPVQRFLHGHGGPDSIAVTLLSEKRPGDSLYVWGWRPQLYVEAKLPPATRFTMTNVLIGATGEVGRTLDDQTPHAYYEPRGWDIFMRELAAERPRFIVDAVRMANLTGDFSLNTYPRIRDYVARNYDRLAVPDAGGVTLYRRKSGR